MANFPVGKVDGNQLQPAAWNQLGSLNNFITSTSQTPSDVDLNQIGKGVAEYAAASTFYTESGISDNYTLTSISSLKASESYVDGMLVRFRTANTNTGACIVNVATLGDIDIKQSDGTSNLTAGQISTTQDTILRYDNSLGVFIIPTNVIIDATTTATGTSYLPKQITISNGSDIDHDIDNTAGNFQFDDDSGQAILGALTKKLNATWIAGTGGGLFTGTVAVDTTYNYFAIYNPTTGVSDAGFDTSLVAANAPAGFTKKLRIFSVLTDGLSNIIPADYYFNKSGGFTAIWKGDPFEDFDGNITTTASNYPLTVPTGRTVFANIVAQTTSATGQVAYLYSPNSDDLSSIGTTYNSSISNLSSDSTKNPLSIATDNNGNIRAESTGTQAAAIYTVGYTDNNL